MRVYLDNCCFNRPFDDQSFLAIRLETEAKLDIQEKIKTGRLSLGWSYILDYENNANPFMERRMEIQTWKELADAFVEETPEILADMDSMILVGLKSVDALHVACAVALRCESFLTVDKGILKKAAAIPAVNVINPINFAIKWESRL
ncbi:MAG: type II toxin-antitoxin system VapC family toxin [Gammaproteobacteria bacterium]|nr:type II toxin-antitoxin system VapC family toxin [Gammaproteobacteria bacterium]